MAVLNDTACAELLRENKTRLASQETYALRQRGMIVRYWPDILREDLHACDSYLKRLVQTVTNPVVDGKVWTGTYKAHETFLKFDDKGKLHLYQVLRLVTYGALIGFASERGPLTYEDMLQYRDSSYDIDAPAAGQGGVYRASNNLKESGLYDSDLQYATGKAQAFEFRSFRTAFSAGVSWDYRNAVDKVEAPALTGSGSYRAQNQLNQFGLYDAALVYHYGLAAAAAEFASERGTLSDQDSWLYKDSPAKIDAPTSGQGGIYRATNSLTDDGLYNAHLVYDQGKAHAMTVIHETFADGGARTHVRHRNASTVPSIAANAARDMYTREFAVNEHGLYDGQVERLQTADKAYGPIIVSKSDDPDHSLYLYENRSNPVDVPAGTWGTGSWNWNPRDNTYSGALRLMSAPTNGMNWLNNFDFAFYFASSKQEPIYVYEKYTASRTDATSHLTDVTAGHVVVGGRDGHTTDLTLLGRGKLRSVRVERKL